MTAEEKFYKRAEELGIENFKHTRYGHYGVETKDGVIILVHESDDDIYEEQHYPSMRELSAGSLTREEIFNQYDAIEEFDNETIGALYRWMKFGDNYDENPYPAGAGYSGVYFGGIRPTKIIEFADEVMHNYTVNLNFQLSLEENDVFALNEDEAIEKALEIVKPKIAQFKERELDELCFDATERG